MKRPGDLAARYGTELFILLLPETERDGALIVADRIRRAVGKLQADHTQDRPPISTGVATAFPISGDSPAALVNLADLALQNAKDTEPHHTSAG